MANQLSLLEQEAKKREESRPVLRGKSEPGNALERYEYALRSLRGGNFKSWSLIDELYEWTSRGPSHNLPKARARMTQFQQAIQDLQQASQKTGGQGTIHWKDGSNGVVSLLPLAILAICNARILAEEDRMSEASKLLLDVAQMGGDQWRNASPIDAKIGIAIQNLAFDNLKTLLLSGGLDELRLTEMNREFELLDSSYPNFGDVVANHAMILGIELKNAGSVRAYLEHNSEKKLDLVTWRYGYSDHLLMASAFSEILASMRRIKEGDQKPWLEACVITRSIDTELGTSSNPLVRLTESMRGGQGWIALQESVKECQARLRLLRIATYYLSHGKPLELKDPFGSNICTSGKSHRIILWSVGRDGIDDGGSGSWDPSQGMSAIE